MRKIYFDDYVSKSSQKFLRVNFSLEIHIREPVQNVLKSQRDNLKCLSSSKRRNLSYMLYSVSPIFSKFCHDFLTLSYWNLHREILLITLSQCDLLGCAKEKKKQQQLYNVFRNNHIKISTYISNVLAEFSTTFAIIQSYDKIPITRQLNI